MNGFGYDELAFHLADSNSYRWFCRIGIGERGPKKSALQKAIKRVQTATWERVNQLLMRYAADKKLENGQKVRTDCTAVESNIRHPDERSVSHLVRHADARPTPRRRTGSPIFRRDPV